MQAEVWSKPKCPVCTRAKTLLDVSNIPYVEHLIGTTHTKEDLLEKVPNAKTVPQIFIDNTYVGGYTELVDYFKSA